MKILAINSSYRGEGGQTQHLINLLFDGVREAGAECESIPLAKLKMNRCLSCNICQQTAQALKDGSPDGQPEYDIHCVYTGKDDVQMVFDKMAAADLLIYATPVYIFNISVLLKTLFDRIYGISYAADFRVSKAGLMFHHINRQVLSKPFVSLIVCDNLEAETPKTLQCYFDVFAQFMDAPIVGKLVRNAGALSGYGDDPEAEKRLPVIPEVYAAYRQAGYELASGGKITRRTQHKANQEIVPVPFFALLKRIKLRQFKEKFVERARSMRSNSMSR